MIQRPLIGHHVEWKVLFPQRMSGSGVQLIEDLSCCILALLKMIRNVGLKRNTARREQGCCGDCRYLYNLGRAWFKQVIGARKEGWLGRARRQLGQEG